MKTFEVEFLLDNNYLIGHAEEATCAKDLSVKYMAYLEDEEVMMLADDLVIDFGHVTSFIVKDLDDENVEPNSQLRKRD